MINAASLVEIMIKYEPVNERLYLIPGGEGLYSVDSSGERVLCGRKTEIMSLEECLRSAEDNAFKCPPPIYNAKIVSGPDDLRGVKAEDLALLAVGDEACILLAYTEGHVIWWQNDEEARRVLKAALVSVAMFKLSSLPLSSHFLDPTTESRLFLDGDIHPFEHFAGGTYHVGSLDMPYIMARYADIVFTSGREFSHVFVMVAEERVERSGDSPGKMIISRLLAHPAGQAKRSLPLLFNAQLTIDVRRLDPALAGYRVFYLYLLDTETNEHPIGGVCFREIGERSVVDWETEASERQLAMEAGIAALPLSV